MECENCHNPCEKTHGKTRRTAASFPGMESRVPEGAPGRLRFAEAVESFVAIRLVGDDGPLAHSYGRG